MEKGQKFLLIDLDGVLSDTADLFFKGMKDGIEETDVSKVRLFPGTADFLSACVQRNFRIFIVSDSHPRYVQVLYKHFFEQFCSGLVYLADKPNTLKTHQLMKSQGLEMSYSPEPNGFVIGDSWLDIEMARGLSIPSILTRFYEDSQPDIRDGIGYYKRNIRSGPAYHARTHAQVLEILDDPLENLTCLEATFQGYKSHRAVKLHTDKKQSIIAHRGLARQNGGESDAFSLTSEYFELCRESREANFLQLLSDGVNHYIKTLKEIGYYWHVFTYIPDKSSTIPRNKMSALFDVVSGQGDTEFQNVLIWKEDVSGSIRSYKNFDERRDFVSCNLHIRPEISVHNKNVVVFDDQYTTGATAYTVCEKLKKAGADNILFIALFYMTNTVESNKICPRCGKRMQIKIRRKDGNKFYSCVLPQYKGNGCGYTENIG